MELVQMVFRSCYDIVPEHLLSFYRLFGLLLGKMPIYIYISDNI